VLFWAQGFFAVFYSYKLLSGVGSDIELIVCNLVVSEDVKGFVGVDNIEPFIYNYG